jgi:hypothetical protein
MARTDELVVVEVAGTEPEADLLCSLLRNAGIDCVPRLTNRGAGAGDGLGTVGPWDRGTVGPHEIMVGRRTLKPHARSCTRVTRKRARTALRPLPTDGDERSPAVLSSRPGGAAGGVLKKRFGYACQEVRAVQIREPEVEAGRNRSRLLLRFQEGVLTRNDLRSQASPVALGRAPERNAAPTGRSAARSNTPDYGPLGARTDEQHCASQLERT